MTVAKTLEATESTEASHLTEGDEPDWRKAAFSKSYIASTSLWDVKVKLTDWIFSSTQRSTSAFNTPKMLQTLSIETGPGKSPYANEPLFKLQSVFLLS